MTTEKTNWFVKAEEDAKDCVREFVDTMCEQWERDRELSDDLHNDYPDGDSYHHESHVDKSYRLTDAAELLDQLSDYEETDSGLWDGLDPREAVSAQAAYTYGNAVLDQWRDIISDLNDDLDQLEINLSDQAPQQWYLEQLSSDGNEWHRFPGEYGSEEEATANIPTEDGEYRVQQEENEDQREQQLTEAGQRYIRLYVELLDFDNRDCEGMIGSALTDGNFGDWTAAMALADWLQEHNQERKAAAIRTAVS